MQRYPLPALDGDFYTLLDQANRSPVILTEETEDRYIVLSVQNYEHLMQSIQTLEDQIWGEAAQRALQDSKTVSSEKFMAALQTILDSEHQAAH
jgi:PHD/YefM family antitoxin component YafN of YafNO toxin-antitoxin module